MVRFRKLAKATSVAIKACSRVLVAAGLDLARLAERIEKRLASK